MKKYLFLIILLLSVTLFAGFGQGFFGFGIGVVNIWDSSGDTSLKLSCDFSEINSDGTTFYDLSGNGIDGTQSGTPIVFGADQYARAASAIYGDGAGAADYVSFNSGDIGKFGTNDFTYTMWVKVHADESAGILCQHGTAYSSADGWALYWYNTLRVYMLGNNVKAVAMTKDAWHFVVLRRKGNTGSISVDAGTPDTFDMTGIDITASYPLNVGGSGAPSLQGWYSSADVYDEAKSESWITTQYNLSAPATPAVYNVPCMGNSILNAGTPAQLNILLKSQRTAVNVATGGDTTVDMIARFTADVINDADAEYVVILGGVNDILTLSASAADIETRLQTMYTAAHNAGLKVIACYMTPWKNNTNWTSDKQATTDSVNTWIPTAINVDYVIDTYTALEDPANADELLPAYDSGDGLHPKINAGNIQIATTIFNGVNWRLYD